MIFYKSLPPELWLRVIDHIENMEEFCRVAALDKSFYRLINTDFRSLCYKNLVYRLRGETWAEAFSL
ncbi:unnamed protein product [Bursaphelenchus okinawaensis]|uniref:F-box domain-containing protein n=1 Tax=Bursaphelenchus okinawaensis TaxID=465554 RepID=A0A811KAA2_9BILA|nr:unnamed protein product [Bursaphelenchus okinawaensis]CAG9099327.1 unnamed protein product [Bursaphelenchus okinawaensis]